MGKRQISVLVADDDQVVLDGTQRMLETASDIRIVGETSSIFSLARLMEELCPDILLMDLSWDGDSTAGWVKIREIKTRMPQTRIIAFTAYELLIPDARKAGADEVITKHFSRQDLIDIIRDVASREAIRTPDSTFPHQEETLTPRELEVLQLLEKGLSDKEISETLQIKLNTAKNHVKSILQKLNIDKRQKAVIRAKELKIIPR